MIRKRGDSLVKRGLLWEADFTLVLQLTVAVRLLIGDTGVDR